MSSHLASADMEETATASTMTTTTTAQERQLRKAERKGYAEDDAIDGKGTNSFLILVLFCIIMSMPALLIVPVHIALLHKQLYTLYLESH